MGLFSKKKKDSPKEAAAKAENREKLADFNVTKAWGVKKYAGAGAMQFIFDKDKRQFVVAQGPVETFREREPWVVDFDQVNDVILEVEETWSEGSSRFDPSGYGRLTQDQYKNVYWRYNFFIIIKTTHPYAGNIRFQTNWFPTITKVGNRGIFYRRGFEIGGKYRGRDLAAFADRMAALEGEEEKRMNREHVVNVVTLQSKDKTIGESVRDGVVGGLENAAYLKRIRTMTNHVKRANRISKLLLS